MKDEYDGGHAGFPFGSFSRARYNTAGDSPPPVRSGAEIYGLSTNNRNNKLKQTREPSLQSDQLRR